MDSRDEEACMEFVFVRGDSVSQQEKVKAFWKFLDDQNYLQPQKGTLEHESSSEAESSAEAESSVSRMEEGMKEKDVWRKGLKVFQQLGLDKTAFAADEKCRPCQMYRTIRNYNGLFAVHEGLHFEVVSCLMELEQTGIWMSRVAHISPGTVMVYRISLVLEVDVVSSKVHCATGAAVNGPVDPESLCDIWSLPIDDVIFLLSVGCTNEILCVNWKPRCQSVFFSSEIFYN
ncbi:uncharacterized protein [Polyergus mexicanus]|uniref:uncharacterized protein isoform X1 n=1 Tax=Polyergus mexicanus TaxID=615972 RepID=UPI0038B476C7